MILMNKISGCADVAEQKWLASVQMYVYMLTEKEICQNRPSVVSVFDLTLKPLLFWIPKLHIYNLYKGRYIVGPSNCTTKSIILCTIQDGLSLYSQKVFEMTIINTVWILKDSKHAV